MQLQTNLSTSPFRNRTPFWLAIALVFCIALVAGAMVAARSGAIDADVERLRTEVSDQEKQIADLNEQLESVRRSQESIVMSASDRVALDEARLLINKKSFSWSRLLSDLEHYVPANSRISSINVGAVSGFGPERVVKIKLDLEGRSQSQVADMITRLDQSGGRFRAEPQSIEPSDDGPTVSYSLAVEYRPSVAESIPLPAAATVLQTDKPTQGGEDADE